MSNEERMQLLKAMKQERTSIDGLQQLRESLHTDIFTIEELEEICKQLHGDFFVTTCALDSSDKDYINELRLTIADLFRILFFQLKQNEVNTK